MRKAEAAKQQASKKEAEVHVLLVAESGARSDRSMGQTHLGGWKDMQSTGQTAQTASIINIATRSFPDFNKRSRQGQQTLKARKQSGDSQRLPQIGTSDTIHIDSERAGKAEHGTAGRPDDAAERAKPGETKVITLKTVAKREPLPAWD